MILQIKRYPLYSNDWVMVIFRRAPAKDLYIYLRAPRPQQYKLF
jgi:hypothetical protein